MTVQDTTAPDTQILSGPSGWINKDSASFSWTGSDLATPKASLQYSYRLDGGAWSPYSGDTTVALEGLGEGLHTFDVRAKDDSSNVDQSEATQTFRVDTIAPSIQDAGHTLQPNAAGWYKSDVTNNFTASEDGSGLANVNQATFSVTSQGQGTTVMINSGPVSDVAGNTNPGIAVGPLQIDKIAPTLAPSVSPNPILLNGSATASAGAQDNLSGIASQGCDPVDTSSVGSKSVSCSARDKAGNTNTANASYSVIYDFKGFFQPIDNLDASSKYVLNVAKAGNTIPIKFSLGGDQGMNILLVGSPSSGSISCDSSMQTDTLEEYSTATVSGLKYDPVANQYIYNWKTASSYAGSCRQLVIKLADGSVHRADFRFTK